MSERRERLGYPGGSDPEKYNPRNFYNRVIGGFFALTLGSVVCGLMEVVALAIEPKVLATMETVLMYGTIEGAGMVVTGRRFPPITSAIIQNLRGNH